MVREETNRYLYGGIKRDDRIKKTVNLSIEINNSLDTVGDAFEF